MQKEMREMRKSEIEWGEAERVKEVEYVVYTRESEWAV